MDTCAAVTIIHNDVFSRIKTKANTLRRIHQPILGANNKPLDVRGTTVLEISLDGITTQHTVYVSKDLAQELLLSADFIQVNNCIVDFNTNSLVVRGSSTPIIQKQTPMVCRVGVAALTIIPPRAMMNVNCKVEKGSLMENQTGVLDPENNLRDVMPYRSSKWLLQ